MVYILKVFLKNPGCDQYEIRRTTDSASYASDYNLLCEKIMKMFPVLVGKCFVLQWIDSDGDKITMSSNEELAHAVSDYDGKTLRIYVNYVEGGEPNRNVGQEPKRNVGEEPKESVGEEPEISDEGIVHQNVVCDGCNETVVGFRYKCLQCHDFDLCNSCSVAGKHPEHDMIKLVSPASEVRNWVFPGWRKMWKSLFGYQGFGKRCFEGRRHHGHHSFGSHCDKKFHPHLMNLQKDICEKVRQFTQNNHELFRNVVSLDDIKAFYETETNSESEDAGACGKTCKKDKKCEKETENKEETEEAKCPKEPEPIEEMKNIKKVETTEHVIAPEVETVKAPEVDENTNCKTVVTEEKKMEDFLPSYPEVTKTSNGAIPKASISPEKSAQSPSNENSPSSSRASSSEKLEEDASSHVDGWTILNAIKDDFMKGSSKFVPFPRFLATDAFDKSTSTSQEVPTANKPTTASAPGEIQGDLESDEAVLNALLKMKAMGFSNEGGWLERLLQTKKGNINEALDSLYPYTARQ